MTIGERIKQARKEKGLTQKRLGELSKTSEITVRQYEIGKRQPRIEQLQRIAGALGVNWTDLCSDDQQADIVTDYYANLKQPPKERIDEAFEYLSPEGQEVAADMVEIVAGNPFYCRQEAPQSPPAPQKRQGTTPPSDTPESPVATSCNEDTTPPPDASETPPEGE